MEPIFHTTAIFRQLYEQMPPLVPEDVTRDMKQALEQVEENMHLTQDELEQTMISFAKKVWPYREAFFEFYSIYEGSLGEQILIRKFSYEMKKNYDLFRESGGTFRDLHTGGGVIHIFSSEERTQLCEALIEMRQELLAYTKQKVCTTDRKKYEQRISEFTRILSDIEHQLDQLRERADNEQEHPELASEIREHIRGFEHGLCLLGPRLDYEAVCRSHEFFDSRKQQKQAHAHTL